MDNEDEDWMPPAHVALLEVSVNRMCSWLVGVLVLGVVSVICFGA